MAARFLISSLQLLELGKLLSSGGGNSSSHGDCHDRGTRSTAREDLLSSEAMTPPLRIRDLGVFAPQGHIAVAEGSKGFLVTYGNSPGLDDPSKLLEKYWEKGPSFLDDMSGQEGWSAVTIDFSASKVVVATDTLGTKPIFIASRMGHDDGPQFAISSHRNELYHLGFHDEVREVNRSTTIVLDLPTTTTKTTTRIDGIRHRPTVGSLTDVKRVIGDILLQHYTGSGPPRIFTLVQEPYEDGSSPIISALRPLPLEVVVYIMSPSGDNIGKMKYVGGVPQPLITIPLLPQEALSKLGR